MAIRIDRVYTRGGDQGETSLVGGQRVAKDSLRIESYGSVDELNAVLGLARVANRDTPAASDPDRLRLDALLERLQNELFNLGSDLARSRRTAIRISRWSRNGTSSGSRPRSTS